MQKFGRVCAFDDYGDKHSSMLAKAVSKYVLALLQDSTQAGSIR